MKKPKYERIIKCDHCKDTGFISACHHDDLDRKDAFGSPWPKIEEFACWCFEGQQKQNVKKFRRGMLNDYKIIKDDF